MLRKIGIEPKGCTLHVPLHKSSEEKISYIFEQDGITKQDIVITIHPGASCPSKRWPAANFIKVADHLSAKYKARIAVITGPEEKATGDRVADAMAERPLNLSGVTTVGDLASVLKRSKLFISNDSGPVHIASAVGTPSVVIFGRKDAGLSPKRWGPTGKTDIVLHRDAGCAECLAHECKVGFKCLKAITPDDVIAAAEKLLVR
jgi:heptosyltransferase-2